MRLSLIIRVENATRFVTPMYDKVKLWLDVCKAWGESSRLVNLLSDAKEQIDLHTGEIKSFGNINGLRVGVYPSGVMIEGSLPKYLHGGSNLFPIGRHDTEDAIGKLSDALGLHVDGAKVVALEFGTNFLMRHKPSAYLDRMGEMPRRYRHRFCTDTLYYKHRGKLQSDIFTFYDKMIEAKTNGMTIPKGFEDANFLRVELRLKGGIARQMGVAQVQASTLHDRTFYHRLMAKYIETYFSIKKLKTQNASFMAEIRTPKDAVDGFMGLLMAKVGQGQQEIDAYLAELKANNIFKDRVSYQRVRDMLYKAASKASLTTKDELVAELDDAFTTLKANGN